ncbi:MAG: hypothetical protein SWX82_04120 [Cyanobacteriota bacterium]|nr:hypothetical protein [Cyanobacteriota bacterium]
MLISSPVNVNYSYVYFSPTSQFPYFPSTVGVRGGSPTQENVEKFLRNGITCKTTTSPSQRLANSATFDNTSTARGEVSTAANKTIRRAIATFVGAKQDEK